MPKPKPILEVIKENFGYDNFFSVNELSNHTDINYKVLQMILKKYHNIEVLHFHHKTGSYYLKTDEAILASRIRTNEMIDKYQLQNKKYKV
jgi:hypothetical protein